MLCNRVKAWGKSSGQRSLVFLFLFVLTLREKKRQRTVLQSEVLVIAFTRKQQPMKIALEYNGIQNGKDLQRRRDEIEHWCGFLET